MNGWLKQQHRFDNQLLKNTNIVNLQKLAKLKEWCISLFKINSSIQEQLRKMSKSRTCKDTELLLKGIHQFKSLINGSFIIVKQPLQVLRRGKGNTKGQLFNAKVLFLIGHL